jgi:hypothetical protein
MSMNTHRITISVPDVTYVQLIQKVDRGKVSRYITNAVEEKLMNETANPVEQFLAMRGELPKVSIEKILQAIRKGRT